jgi:hypothetical protein
MTCATAGRSSRVLLVLPFLLAFAGCASARYTDEYPLIPSVRTSHDGLLRYRVPRGWFAAAPDSGAPQNVVWLLQNNYKATLAVSEIVVDSEANRAVRNGGLERLAQLTMTLVSGDNSAVLTREPELFELSGRQFCAYETEITETGDMVRVVVFATSAKIYEVTALARSGEQRDKVFDAQQGFLSSLRW